MKRVLLAVDLVGKSVDIVCYLQGQFPFRIYMRVISQNISWKSVNSKHLQSNHWLKHSDTDKANIWHHGFFDTMVTVIVQMVRGLTKTISLNAGSCKIPLTQKNSTNQTNKQKQKNNTRTKHKSKNRTTKQHKNTPKQNKQINKTEKALWS